MRVFSLNCAESFGIGHAHFRLLFLSLVCKMSKTYFSNSSQVISLVCTKLGTQHLWTLLTKVSQKSLNSTINFKVIK